MENLGNIESIDFSYFIEDIYMDTTFNSLIEELQKLPHEEKKEVKSLLERYIIEEERERILISYQESLKELKAGKLEFTGDLDELKGMLNDD